MELKGLKERKRIQNDRLMRFEGGLDIPGGRMEGVGFPSSEQPSFDINQSPSGTALQNGTAINRPTQNYAQPEPAYKASSAAGAGPWFALGEWAGTGVLEGLDRIGINSQFVNNTRDRWLQDAGTTQGSIGGIGYEQQNLVSNDTVQNEKDAYTNEAGMAWATNPFKAATMWIGRQAHMRKLERAQELANREAQLKNSYNSNMAQSKFMNMQAIGNQNSQMLYAKNGKDVETAFGKINIAPNALTEDGEVIYNPRTASARTVPGNKKGDSNYSLINPEDVIFTNKFGLSKAALRPAKALSAINKADNKFRGSIGKQTDKFVKERATKELNELADLQKDMRALGVLQNNNKQNMIHAASGWESIVPIINSLSNIGVAIGQYIRHKHDPIKQSDSYRDNPYAGYALQGLNNLRYSYDPIARRVLDYDAQGRYRINNLGGLGQSQKGLAIVGQTLGTQRNLIDLMSDIDNKNISLRNNYYSNILQQGERNRNALIDAIRYDDKVYALGHGAKEKAMATDIASIIAQKNQGVKDYLQYLQYANELNKYEV